MSGSNIKVWHRVIFDINLFSNYIFWKKLIISKICNIFGPIISRTVFCTCNKNFFFGFSGLIYNNKYYLMDTYNPVVYDGATNAWTGMAIPSYFMSLESCSFVWRDSIFVFGYYRYQKYSFTTQQWSILNTSPPSPFYNPACLVLPTDEVLVVGSAFSLRQSLMYNPLTNTWRTLPNLNLDQGSPSLVQLGSRIFAVGGLNITAEEYNPTANTWTMVPFNQKYAHRGYSSTLAVPADLFANRAGGCNGI